MELKSIVVALLLLAILFGWYAWLEAGERRRRKAGGGRGSSDGSGAGGASDADGELWKAE